MNLSSQTLDWRYSGVVDRFRPANREGPGFNSTPDWVTSEKVFGVKTLRSHKLALGGDSRGWNSSTFRLFDRVEGGGL